MRVLIPFRPVNPKTRLSEVMSREERERFAFCMLLDVLRALENFDCDVRIISTHPMSLEGYEVEVDSRELDEAINSRIEGETAVIMPDIPLINEKVLERFFGTEGDVVIAPGRRGGTNMILIRKDVFRVSYHYCSYVKHSKRAKDLKLRLSTFDSFFASVDVDRPEDLLEIMIHGEGKISYDYLKSIGFKVEFEREPKLVRV